MVVLVAGVAAAGGYLARGGSTVPPRPAPPVATASAPRIVMPPPAGVELEALRAVVREELARATAETSVDTPAPDRVVETPGASIPVDHHLGGALERGTGTENDRQRLWQTLPELQPTERERVLKRLAQLMNEGSIVLAPDVLPL